MSEVAVLRRWSSEGGKTGARLYLWCPGCEDLHAAEVSAEGAWTWDGNIEAPTISPSLLVQGTQWATDSSFYKPQHHVEAGQRTCCHSFVKQGQWQFLSDCTHALANQIVPLVPLPEGHVLGRDT